MSDYFKVGAFAEKLGRSWHGQEAYTAERPLVDMDSVSDAMRLARINGRSMYGIEAVVLQPQIDVTEYVDPVVDKNGNPVRCLMETDHSDLLLAHVPWTENGIQPLHRKVKWYQPLQNAQLARSLDSLTIAHGGGYTVAGVLHCGHVGQVVAVQLLMEPFEVGGEEDEQHMTFLLVSEDRKSGKKHFSLTTTRVVCWNTYSAAIGGMVAIPNGGEPEKVLSFKVRLEQLATKARQEQRELLGRLFTVKVSNQDVANYVERIVPDPKASGMMILSDAIPETADTEGDPVYRYIAERGDLATKAHEAAIRRTVDHRNAIIETFSRFNDEFPYAAGSAYALWQATTEHFNHSSLWKGDAASGSYNVLFGGKRGRALDDAWGIMRQFAK